MNNSSWLCKISSRWDKRVDQEALAALKARPEVEALKVWLALLALPLVEAQAKVQSSNQQVDPNGQAISSHKELISDDEYRINAARIQLIASIFQELETVNRFTQVIDGH